MFFFPWQQYTRSFPLQSSPNGLAGALGIGQPGKPPGLPYFDSIISGLTIFWQHNKSILQGLVFYIAVNELKKPWASLGKFNFDAPDGGIIIIIIITGIACMHSGHWSTLADFFKFHLETSSKRISTSKCDICILELILIFCTAKFLTFSDNGEIW